MIDRLIDIPHEDHDLMIQRFANYIRMVFKQSSSLPQPHPITHPCPSPFRTHPLNSLPLPLPSSLWSIIGAAGDSTPVPLLRMASQALGHLARAGGTQAPDIVDSAFRMAIRWLQSSDNKSALSSACRPCCLLLLFIPAMYPLCQIHLTGLRTRGTQRSLSSRSSSCMLRRPSTQN